MSDENLTPKKQGIVYEDAIFNTIDHFTIKQGCNSPKVCLIYGMNLNFTTPYDTYLNLTDIFFSAASNNS